MRGCYRASFVTPIEVGSSDDPRLDPFRSIKGQGRRGDGTFVAESELVLDRLLEADFPIRAVLITPARAARIEGLLRDAQVNRREPFAVFVAPGPVIDAVVGYRLHRGVITLAERRALPSARDALAASTTVVVLEDVSDPDNIGAIFRHAAAFGVDAVILHGHTADPLYRKAIRTSMGCTLTIPFCRTRPDDGPIANLLHDSGFASLALTPDPSAIALPEAVSGLDGSTRVALLVGAEGPGLRADTMQAAKKRVRIPMSAGVDSLNVATSAAIALFALTAAQPARLRRS